MNDTQAKTNPPQVTQHTPKPFEHSVFENSLNFINLKLVLLF